MGLFQGPVRACVSYHLLFFFKQFYLFISGCAGSSLLLRVSLRQRAGAPLQSECAGFSGLRSLRFSGSVGAAPGAGAQAQSLWHRVQSLHSTWGLPSPGVESMSATLAGGVFTTGPPGKSSLPISVQQTSSKRISLKQYPSYSTQFLSLGSESSFSGLFWLRVPREAVAKVAVI